MHEHFLSLSGEPKSDSTAMKGNAMSHKLSQLLRFIGDFQFYRGKGYAFKAAWYLASMPMP
jgi:hypothetical protein